VHAARVVNKEARAAAYACLCNDGGWKGQRKRANTRQLFFLGFLLFPLFFHCSCSVFANCCTCVRAPLRGWNVVRVEFEETPLASQVNNLLLLMESAHSPSSPRLLASLERTFLRFIKILSSRILQDSTD